MFGLYKVHIIQHTEYTKTELKYHSYRGLAIALSKISKPITLKKDSIWFPKMSLTSDSKNLKMIQASYKY